MPLLEEVFCRSGTPTLTFVEPDRFNEIKVAIRTPGRCVVIEGPWHRQNNDSKQVVEALGRVDEVINLSARRPKDIEAIRDLPNREYFGIAIIDDFHRLPPDLKSSISDFYEASR